MLDPPTFMAWRATARSISLHLAELEAKLSLRCAKSLYGVGEKWGTKKSWEKQVVVIVSPKVRGKMQRSAAKRLKFQG